MALGRVVTLPCVASKQTKKIPEKPRLAFARELQRLIDAKYEGNQTKAAKALHVTQGHISALIRGDRGPGLNVLLLMRLETGKTIDEILGFAASPESELQQRLVATVELDVARIRAENREMNAKLDALLKERERTPTDEKTDGGSDAAVDSNRVRKRNAGNG